VDLEDDNPGFFTRNSSLPAPLIVTTDENGEKTVIPKPGSTYQPNYVYIVVKANSGSLEQPQFVMQASLRAVESLAN